MKSFRLFNMKSFIDSGNIEIKPITIFVGMNSCGKSSLLRFPAVLGQTFLTRTEIPLTFFGKYVDYGSFESVVHKNDNTEGENNKTIKFDVKYNISTEEFYTKYLSRYFEKEEFSPIKQYIGDCFEARMEVTIDKPQKQIKTKQFCVFYNDRLLVSFDRKADEDNIYEYTIYLRFTEEGIVETRNSIDISIEDFRYFVPLFSYDEAIDIFGEKVICENPGVSDDFYESALDVFGDQIDFASEVVRIIVDSIQGDAHCISYIGPFREDPKRIYRDTENDIRDVGAKGESLSTILLRESEKQNGMIDQVSKWLYQNYGYTLEIAASSSGYFTILLVDKNGVKSNIMDVGYGISQVLPIITQLIRITHVRNRTYLDKTDEIVMIEQPELHLHPDAQASLAEVIMLSVEMKDSLRVILETHSEHLIRKLQVLVAKKQLSPNMIAVYSIEKDEDGSAIVKKMEINDAGRFLTKWPSGFFDKSHELASELREATASEV